jgi:hypothetical protein
VNQLIITETRGKKAHLKGLKGSGNELDRYQKVADVLNNETPEFKQCINGGTVTNTIIKSDEEVIGFS